MKKGNNDKKVIPGIFRTRKGPLSRADIIDAAAILNANERGDIAFSSVGKDQSALVLDYMTDFKKIADLVNHIVAKYYMKPKSKPAQPKQDHASQGTLPHQSSDLEKPIQVLKMRLAKGKITKEEYEELRQVLES